MSTQETRRGRSRLKRDLAETAANSQDSRERLIEGSSQFIARTLQQVPPRYQWREPEEITGISRQLFWLTQLGTNPETFTRYRKQRGRLYTQLLREVRKDQKVDFLLDLHRDIFQEGRFEDQPIAIDAALAHEFTYLYLFLCKEGEFLTGLKGGACWQPYNVEGVETDKESIQVETATTTQICQLAPFIGEEELELVPKRFILLADLENLDIPEPAKTIEGFLEEAYRNQHFLVPQEGALVRFLRAGDVKEVLIRQAGENVLGKFFTSEGEFLAGINLDTARHFPLIREHPVTQTFCEILAEVYRDLVILKRIPAGKRIQRREQRGKLPSIKIGETIIKRGVLGESWIWIPRREGVYLDDEEWRPLLEEKRPIRPHRVRGHFRTLPEGMTMSDDQIAVVLDFERRTRLRILELLPEGCTFVRPHVSPKGTEAEIAKLPRFLKKGIEQEIIERFRDRAQKLLTFGT